MCHLSQWNHMKQEALKDKLSRDPLKVRLLSMGLL